MSILTSPLPQTAAGAAVDTDFRCMLRFEALLFDEQIPAEAKVHRALKDFYPHGYHCTADEAWAGLLWFYRCGAPTAQPSGSSAAEPVTDTKLEELTREVREHNNFARRVPVIEEQIKVANHRISDLENQKGA